MSLSLSSLELIRIIGLRLNNYETFVEELMSSQNKLLLPNIYKGWQGVDSEFCIVLIHYSVEHVKERTLSLSSFSKAEVSDVYNRIYNRYSAVCASAGWSFVPCIKGLATILGRKKNHQ